MSGTNTVRRTEQICAWLTDAAKAVEEGEWYKAHLACVAAAGVAAAEAVDASFEAGQRSAIRFYAPESEQMEASK